jgi:exopolysaccharide biosynthesis polyprenyl glycosylphosphotransferase
MSSLPLQEAKRPTAEAAAAHRAVEFAEPRKVAKGFAHDWAPAALYLLFDVLGWLAIYSLATILRGAGYAPTTPFSIFLIEVVQLAVIVAALFVIGGYDRHTETRSLSYTAEHILAVIAAAAASALLIYSAAAFGASIKPSRSVLLVSFITFLPVSLSYRRWIRRFVAEASANKIFLVIGSSDVAARFKETYEQSDNPQKLEFVASEDLAEGESPAKIDNLDGRYSGIIVAEPPNRLQPQLLDRLVRTQFQRTRVYTLESFYETHWRYVPLNAIDPVWPLQTGFQLARISIYHYLKRLFDLIVSTIALIFFSPIVALVALWIWLEDGRPIIFAQERVGRDEHPFILYKFRTMKRGSGEDTEEIYTRSVDPRLLGVGRWTRKLRLDELPQLWNVFRGEMSLIGPRPEWTRCSERYEKKIPFYHFRHLVKPGITGWAQVNYPYGDSEADALEKLKYDLYYIRHYSLKLDAMIVLKTIHTMFFGKGR